MITGSKKMPSPLLLRLAIKMLLRHADISTTMYDKRDHRPEDSPTYRVKY